MNNANGFTLVARRFPASPLVPVRGADGKPMRFPTREEAQAEATRLNSRMSRNVPGGGPSYFVA